MDMKRWIAVGAIAVATVAVGTGLAVAGSGEDGPLVGADLDRATTAALAHTGGGTVIESEIGDDGAAYGVEIRLEDGSVVEVALDARFRVIGAERDDDAPGETDAPND